LVDYFLLLFNNFIAI